MTSTSRYVVFAYGSNMLTERLRERCPSAQPLGTACLSGYVLRWHKISKDGSGKCDIEPSDSSGACVMGVLYEIAGSEKAALDVAEGLGRGYKEIEVKVLCQGQQMTAKAYQATRVNNAFIPYSWYRALVIAGAKQHQLPEDYIACLVASPAKEDPDRDQHRKNMRLIGIEA